MAKIITTVIKDCIQCPKWIKCKPIKALTKLQRFTIQTGVGLNGFILNECPLEDAPKADKSDDKSHKKAHVRLHNALDELFANYINHHPDEIEFTEMPFIKLMEWSNEQTQNPTELKEK